MYYAYIIISVLGSLAVTLKRQLMDSVWDIWKPVLIIAVVFVSLILLHIVMIMIVSIFAGRNKNNPFFRWFSVQSLGIALKLARIKLIINGEELIPKDRRFLMVGNHCSIFDPMIAIYAFRRYKLAFVSKKENLKIPFIGRLMSSIGCVSIDRKNNRSAAHSVDQASEQIISGDLSMGIYPEGKINKTDEQLLPFRNGAFKIALKTQVPIVVTVMRNTRMIYKRAPFAHTDVYIDIAGIIQHEEYSLLKTSEVSRMVREMMCKKL